MIDPMKFTGWVEKILPATDFEQRFVVANYRNETAKQAMKQAHEFPNALMFTLSVRNGANAQLDDISEGDKIEVKYFLAGKSGTSPRTGKYYCINNLNVAKTNGLTLIDRRERDPKNQPSLMDAPDDDIPF